MTTFKYARPLRAALIGFAMTGSVGIARADVKDYEFQLVDQAVHTGPEQSITVKLVNKTTGKPVPDAIIIATRLDMAPEGMKDMATKIVAVPGAEDGTYKFKANLSMAGRWQLSLGAKIQGENGIVENKLVITAEK